MVKIIIRMSCVLYLLACTFGCDIRSRPKIEKDPKQLEGCLGVELPKTISDPRVQIIKNVDQGTVTLIAKFGLPKSDLTRLIASLGMVQSTKGDSIVLDTPLLGTKAEASWWTPPDIMQQKKIMDRFAASEQFKQGGKYSMALIWIDGVVYMSKFGPY